MAPGVAGRQGEAGEGNLPRGGTTLQLVAARGRGGLAGWLGLARLGRLGPADPRLVARQPGSGPVADNKLEPEPREAPRNPRHSKQWPEGEAASEASAATGRCSAAGTHA